MDYKIIAKCSNGHTQEFTLHNFTEEAARDYAAILDGTHPMYVIPPRADPNTFIGHCLTCNGLFETRVVAVGKQV